MLFFFVTYAALIPIPSNIYLPENLRIALFKWRPFLAGALILIGIFLLVVWRGRMLLPNQRTVFVLGLIMPAYLLMLAGVRNISLEVVALYALWALFSFALAPMVLREALPSVAKWLTFTYGGILILSAYFARGPAPVDLPRSPTMGFLNENYYGQIVQVFICSWMLWRISRGKKLAPVVLIGSLLFIYLFQIAARNVVVFMLVFAGSYLYLTRGRTWLGRALFPLAVVLTLIGTFTYVVGYTTTSRDVSSGRLGIWASALEVMNEDQHLPQLAWATGAATRTVEGGPAYNPIRGEALFLNVHVDNTYLDILLLGGVLGLLLFLLPYAIIVRKAGPRTRLTSVALAILAGVAVQSAFVSSAPTFGSPVGFLLGLVGSLPLLIPHLLVPIPGASSRPSKAHAVADLRTAATSL